MSALSAHLLCIALVAIDLAARALRIRSLVRAQGQEISLAAAIEVNALGDAACAVTPLRLGGEAARLAALMHRAVPAVPALGAIGLEVAIAWPVTLLAAAIVAWCFAPAWWRETAPLLLASLQRIWPWFAGFIAACAACWFAARRLAPASLVANLRPLETPHLSRTLVFGAMLCSLVNVVARVAVLPVLALTLDMPPAIGTVIVGSFALLYSQLFLPTPSGIGAVEFGFLAGAAGHLGPGVAGLLLAWRSYTSGAGLVLGIAAAVHIFGCSELLARLRGRGTKLVSGRDDPVTSPSPG